MSAFPLFPLDPAVETLDLNAFVNRHRRLPKLGDVPAPWHYRGWLLPYVLQLHAVLPAVADRWDYYLCTLAASRLLDEPIPQIHFGAPNQQVFTLLRDWSRLVGQDDGGWSDFRTLVDWLCWSLALSQEPVHLNEATHERLYRQVNLGPLLETPFDYLGEFVAMNKAGRWNPTGFYPTPHSVVECLVRLTLPDVPQDGRDPRKCQVNDPCVGSGRMLLHASNTTVCLAGQDIDPLAVALCKINGALYAPWLAFPFPAAITATESGPCEPACLPYQAPGWPKWSRPLFSGGSKVELQGDRAS